jgi:hypothetical protein
MEPPDRFVLDHHHLFDWRSGAGLGSDWVCSRNDRDRLSFSGRRRVSVSSRIKLMNRMLTIFLQIKRC